MRSFHPPKRILMGPGPSEPSPRVLRALGQPTIGYMDPATVRLMDEVKDGLHALFRAPDHATAAISGPGSAAMECGIMSLLRPGDLAVAAVNGAFSSRMADIAARVGATVVRVEHEWGEPVDLARVEAALAGAGARILTLAHAETSTGVANDAAGLCALARRHGAMSVVDCVASLGGQAVEGGGWDADYLFSASQKCLSVPPGVAPVAIGPRARAAMLERGTPPGGWVLDGANLLSLWGWTEERIYHHTAPVNGLYGLHEALVEVFEEGLEAVIDRHRRCAEALWAGLEGLGFAFLVADPARRTPQLTALRIPEGVDEARLRARLLDDWNLEIGAGFGKLRGQILRIGLMGASATPWHVRFCLSALAEAMAADDAIAWPIIANPTAVE